MHNNNTLIDLLVYSSFLLPGIFIIWSIILSRYEKKHGPKVSHWLIFSIIFTASFIAYNLFLPWGILIFAVLGGLAAIIALNLSSKSLHPLWQQKQHRIIILVVYFIPLVVGVLFISYLSRVGP